ALLAVGLSSAYEPVSLVTGAVVHWGYATSFDASFSAVLRVEPHMHLIEYVGDSEDEIDNVSRIYWAPPLPRLIDNRLSSMDVGEPSSLIPSRPSKRRRESPTRNPSSSKTLKRTSSSKTLKRTSSSRTAPTASSSKANAASSSKKVVLSSFDANIQLDVAKTRKRKATPSPDVRPHKKLKKSNVEQRDDWSKAVPQ
ncbi:hypothetical protein CPB85DRAFT_1294318, partial [Mucidula mucida]